MKRSLTFDFVFVYMYLRPHLSKRGHCTRSRRVPLHFFFYILYLWLPTQSLKVLVEVESQVFLFYELDICESF